MRSSALEVGSQKYQKTVLRLLAECNIKPSDPRTTINAQLVDYLAPAAIIVLCDDDIESLLKI